MTDGASPRPRRFDREVDGILLLDKPVGLSSNAALQQARRLFRAVKAGHAGSLDPLASGLLPVCFGQGTKVCGHLLDSGKTYRVTIRLGEQTDTADGEGQVVATRAVPPLDADRVRSVLRRFLGEQTQIPPMYSALKKDGQRLYQLARRGETVERVPRRIRIDRLELVAAGEGMLELEVACSKGTYIRSLAEDIAHALGTLGHVVVLRRLAIDAFAGGTMVSLETLGAALSGDDGPACLDRYLLPIDHVFSDLPAVCVDSQGADDVLHGRAIRPLEATVATAAGVEARIYGPDRRFLALARCLEDGRLQPSRLFVRAAGLAG